MAETTNKTLSERGIEAAARLLERKGYDIVERGWACEAGEADIVALDGETVVFVDVSTRDACENGFPMPDVAGEADGARARREAVAAAYLAASDYVDVPVRFDSISLMVIGDSRAFVRHRVNCLG